MMGNGTWVFGGPQSGKVRKNMRMDDQPGGLDHKQGAGRREIGAQTAVLVDQGETWAPGTKETRSPCVCEGRVWGLAQPEAGGSGRVLPGPHPLGRRVIPSGAPGLSSPLELAGPRGRGPWGRLGGDGGWAASPSPLWGGQLQEHRPHNPEGGSPVHGADNPHREQTEAST